MADALIRTGSYKRILVVGAETLSRIVDWKDRETCILFGDGAGAVIVGASEDVGSSRMHGFSLGANGALGQLLYLDSGRPHDPLALDSNLIERPHVHMRGREIFKSAVRAMARLLRKVLLANECTIKDVDWVYLTKPISASSKRSVNIEHRSPPK